MRVTAIAAIVSLGLSSLAGAQGCDLTPLQASTVVINFSGTTSDNYSFTEGDLRVTSSFSTSVSGKLTLNERFRIFRRI